MNTQPLSSISSDELTYQSYDALETDNSYQHYPADDKHDESMFVGIDYIATDRGD